jgi:hypothetical protein
MITLQNLPPTDARALREMLVDSDHDNVEDLMLEAFGVSEKPLLEERVLELGFDSVTEAASALAQRHRELNAADRLRSVARRMWPDGVTPARDEDGNLIRVEVDPATRVRAEHIVDRAIKRTGASTRR